MSVSTQPPPAPAPKKSGLGCLGCGCLILALLAVLFLALVGAGIYGVYSQFIAITSTVPLAVPAFDGGDEMYNTAKQKLSDFDHDLQNHVAAKLELSGDEINTLIARQPAFTQSKTLLYVSVANNEATIQLSLPTGLISDGYVTGRYLNATSSFGLDFDADNKTLMPDLHDLQIGEKAMPKNVLPALQGEFTPVLNGLLQGDPEGKLVLNQAKSIRIENDELVIETQ